MFVLYTRQHTLGICSEESRFSQQENMPVESQPWYMFKECGTKSPRPIPGCTIVEEFLNSTNLSRQITAKLSQPNVLLLLFWSIVKEDGQLL